jgi:hypothetical protein
MNKDNANKFRMLRTVKSTMDDNSSIWNTIPILVETKNQLDGNIDKIDALDAANNADDSKTITVNKEKQRQQLADKIVIVAGILHSYAAINNDQALMNIAKVNRSDITRGKETDVSGFVEPVLHECRNKMNELAPYALTEDMILEVENTLDEYKELIGQPRTSRNKYFATINQVDQLIEESMQLLNNTIDKLMLRFQYTNEDYYNQYLRAREIVGQ